MKFEIHKQTTFENVTGLVLTVWIHEGKDGECPHKYLFDDIESVASWLSYSYGDLTAGRLPAKDSGSDPVETTEKEDEGCGREDA